MRCTKAGRAVVVNHANAAHFKHIGAAYPKQGEDQKTEEHLV